MREPKQARLQLVTNLQGCLQAGALAADATESIAHGQMSMALFIVWTVQPLTLPYFLCVFLALTSRILVT
jgi:hypothetical protein